MITPATPAARDHRRRSSLRRGAALSLASTLLVLAAFLALPASTPAASRYVLVKCDSSLPGGGVEGAAFTGTAPYEGWQNCFESGGSFIIRQGGAAASSSAFWSVPLPPPAGGSVESVTVTAQLCNGTNHDPETVAFAVSEGWTLSCAPETRSFPVNSTLGNPGIVHLGCQGSCEQDPFAWAHYFAAVEVDPVAPQVTSVGGGLVSGSTIRGQQTILGIAEDLGGGVAQLSLRVDGQPASAPQMSTCATYKVADPSYTGVATTTSSPCPSKAEAQWTVNTAAPPFHEGPNDVAVCAQDFSTIGAANESCSTRSVVVENSCPESGAPGGDTLNARFAHMKGTVKSVRYGRGAKVSGRLIAASGTPVGGATICVALETEGSTSGLTPATTTSTDAEGRFVYYMPPGPNRNLRLAFRHGAEQVEKLLTLQTHALPRLSVTPPRLKNGESVTLRGSLPRPGPAGRVVVLQAAVPGAHRWITFRKATTGRRGRFDAQYHFTSTTRTIAYHFRAVVPRQSGYPWLEGISKPKRVTVSAGRRASPNGRKTR